MLIVRQGICSRSTPNFSGVWKQSNERCVPKRTGDIVLHIEHRGSDLTVETTMLRGSAPPRHAVQHYTTDGITSVSTGVDGDEFHTSIVWSGQSLAFSVKEHEDGRVIPSKETWTLIENGNALRRSRDLGVLRGRGSQEDADLPLPGTRQHRAVIRRRSMNNGTIR